MKRKLMPRENFAGGLTQPDSSQREEKNLRATETQHEEARICLERLCHEARCENFDDLPEAAFYMVGGLDEVKANAERMTAAA